MQMMELDGRNITVKQKDDDNKLGFNRDKSDTFYDSSVAGSRSVNTGGGATRNGGIAQDRGSFGQHTINTGVGITQGSNRSKTIRPPGINSSIGTTNYGSRAKNYSPNQFKGGNYMHQRTKNDRSHVSLEADRMKQVM